MDDDIGRLPPQDNDAEQAVLGSCLIDSDAYLPASTKLQPADWYRERHRHIWTAMSAIDERRERIDLLTLKAELERQGKLDDAGGAAYLAQLSEAVPSALHAEHYASIVARLATLRRLIAAGGQIAAIGYDTTADPDTALARAEQALLDIRKTRSSTALISPRERAERAMEWLTALHEGVKPGIPFGLADLDFMTGGAQKGQLILVGGRPGDGKSTLLQTMAGNMSKTRTCLYCTLEMTEQDVTKRELSWLTKINLQKVHTGSFGNDEFGRLIGALGALSESNCWVCDEPGATTATIRQAATEMQLRNGLDVLFIDYLQLLNDERQGSNDVGRVTYISRQLMNIAKALGVPVIVATQLNRASEGREDQLPHLSDLRESGAQEQDAHVVLLIHRQREANSATKADATKLIIAKQRQGPVGTIDLQFMPKLTRFCDASRREEERPW